MGNYQGNNQGNNMSNQEYMKTDRLIDGENQVTIGFVHQKDPQNPLSSQAIRVGLDGKLKRLEKFIETSNSLTYEFESDTVLTLSKRDKDIIINLKEPDTQIHLIKPMDSIVREISKPIGWGSLSQDLDKIPSFIRPELDDIQTEIGKSIANGEQ